MKLKVLISKIGLDGHDRGAKLISRYLRDQGMEIIYLGIRQKPDSIPLIAVQEDVDLIGISILAGGQKELLSRLMRKMKEIKCECPVIVGGILPDADIEFLENLGICKIYRPGVQLEKIKEDIFALFE